MIHDAVLMRATDKVYAYIDKYVTLAGAEKREEVIELFNSMQQLFPHWVIITCPVMQPDMFYASKNCPFVFGYDCDYLARNTTLDKLFRHTHEADQADLYKCFSFMHEQLASVPPEDHHKFRTVFHYRFRKADGQYMYLHDEKASLRLNGGLNFYYALLKDVTSEKPFTGVKVELFKQDQYLQKIKEYKPSSERNPLSKREEELVTLIRQGLSTKEIAWYLKISHNTVRNIKSKLFEKFNVNNSIELLNMTA